MASDTFLFIHDIYSKVKEMTYPVRKPLHAIKGNLWGICRHQYLPGVVKTLNLVDNGLFHAHCLEIFARPQLVFVGPD